MASAPPPRTVRLRAPEFGGRGLDRFAGAVLLVYALARLVSALLLVLLTHYQVATVWTGPSVTYATIVGQWDAGWYGEIATNGYPAVLPHDPATGQLQQNAWAFYPLFPYLTKALMLVTGGPFAITGAMLSLVLGGAAAWVIASLLRPRVGDAPAIAAVAVWATCAPSPVLQVAYTESLAILLLALVLRALDREHWWQAAGFALLTGLARPIAVPLGLVALVAVGVRLWRRRERPLRRGEPVGLLAALVSCGVAGLMWPTIAWAGTGIRSAYTATMATWRSGQHIEPLTPWWGYAKWYFGGPQTDGTVPAICALGAAVVLIVGLAVGPWAARLGPVLRAWMIAYPFYLAVVLDPGTSAIRYLLPCFPWAVLAVDGAWRRRPGRGRREWGPWPHAMAWALFGIATQWWWLYELWRFVPPTDFPP